MAQGLERIDAAGAEFDPSLHEAILQVEQEECERTDHGSGPAGYS